MRFSLRSLVGAIFIRRPAPATPPGGTICFVDDGTATGWQWGRHAVCSMTVSGDPPPGATRCHDALGDKIMRNALRNRIERVEQREGRAWRPAPEGGVIYAGPRNPMAIVAALGLGHMREFSIEVLDQGSPDDPPRLVSELTESGRYGLTQAFADHSRLVSQLAHAGGSWSFSWQRDGRGFVMDWNDPTGEVFREYQCGGSDEARP